MNVDDTHAYLKQFLGNKIYLKYIEVKDKAGIASDVEFVSWLLKQAECTLLSNISQKESQKEVVERKIDEEDSSKYELSLINQNSAIFGSSATPATAADIQMCDKEISIQTPYTDPPSYLNSFPENNSKSPGTALCRKRKESKSSNINLYDRISSYCSQCKSSIENTKQFHRHQCMEGCEDTERKSLLYECMQCNQVFKNGKTARCHIYRTHVRSQEDASVICEICGKQIDKYYKKNHDLSHSQICSEECTICGAKYRQRSKLNFHIKIQHNGVRFKCNVCDKIYRSNSSLKVHKLTHETDRKFPCGICLKPLGSASSLNKHKKIHNDQRGVLCAKCGMNLSSKESLEIHLRTHTMQTPYACNFENCSKSFRQKSILTEHIRQVHTKEKPFSCEVCDKKFVTSSKLNRHKKVVHSKATVDHFQNAIDVYKSTLSSALIVNKSSKSDTERFILPKSPFLIEQIGSNRDTTDHIGSQRLANLLNEQKMSISQTIPLVHKLGESICAVEMENSNILLNNVMANAATNRCNAENLVAESVVAAEQVLYTSNMGVTAAHAITGEDVAGSNSLQHANSAQQFIPLVPIQPPPAATVSSVYEESMLPPPPSVSQLSQYERGVATLYQQSILPTTMAAAAPQIVESAVMESSEQGTDDFAQAYPYPPPMPQYSQPNLTSLSSVQATAEELTDGTKPPPAVYPQPSPSTAWTLSIDTLLMAASRNNSITTQNEHI